MKKVLVSAAGPNMQPILENFSMPTFERFAVQHGYEIHAEQLTADGTQRKSVAAKTARWQKMRIIRKMLTMYDLVVWFDADVLICRNDEDIANYLNPDAFQGLVLHSVPAENRINPNTGVWIMRRCEMSFEFLDAVEKNGIPEGRWADQGAVLRALEWELGDERYRGAGMPSRTNHFLERTAWLPVGWNQPYCENRPDPDYYAGRPLDENPHTLHFMAMTIDERIKAMGDLLENLEIMKQ